MYTRYIPLYTRIFQVYDRSFPHAMSYGRAFIHALSYGRISHTSVVISLSYTSLGKHCCNRIPLHTLHSIYLVYRYIMYYIGMYPQYISPQYISGIQVYNTISLVFLSIYQIYNIVFKNILQYRWYVMIYDTSYTRYITLHISTAQYIVSIYKYM